MVERGMVRDSVLAAWIARNNMLLLTLMVVSVVSLMVLPIPEFLLDTFIAINIAVSVALLLITIYINSPLGLSTFPTLLLVTTLLRLSLNIASSRSILLHADAGHIIETFGRLVVGGNVIVGLVVFTIITIVQFIVVAKGSERVAEVAARFTLDAMPGKQMSIDADLRAGMIDKEEAKRRRKTLEQESQLHGAMDGAMKFVKGDAIAGLLIAFVNLLAGLTVGVVMHDMTFAEAANRYSVLTVGDGMVSQIPSLFVSVAAGVLTTRVSGNDTEDLGRQIVQQVLSKPAALLITGFIMSGFLLIPGFPTLQIGLLAAVIGGIGFILYRQSEMSKTGQHTPVPAMQGEGSITAPPEFIEYAMPKISVPMLVKVSDEVAERLHPEVFASALTSLREQLHEHLGLPFPGVRLVLDRTLPEGTYHILVNDVRVADGSIPSGRRPLALLPGSPPPPDLVIDKERAFAGHIGWLSVSEAIPDGVEEIDIDFILMRHISSVIYSRPHEFLGMQDVQRLLQRAEAELNDLVKEVVKVVPLQRITEVLRRLLQERIPIRNLRAIGESLVNWGPKEKDIVALTELVRVELGRWIVHSHTAGSDTLSAVLIHPDTEANFKRSIQHNAGGSFLAIGPEDRKKFCSAIEGILKSADATRARPILVTTMDLRRYARKLVETAHPELVVLSYEEIGGHAGLSVCGTVSL